MARVRLNRQCPKCKYGIMMGKDAACGYMLATGKMRGCEIHPKCAKYEPLSKRGRKRTIPQSPAATASPCEP